MVANDDITSGTSVALSLINRRTFLRFGAYLAVSMAVYADRCLAVTTAAQAAMQSQSYGTGTYGLGKFPDLPTYNIYLPAVAKEEI